MEKREVKWQDDSAFIGWMYEHKYIEVDPGDGKVKHYFSGDGIILYMHEAWRGALKFRNDQLLSDIPFPKPRNTTPKKTCK